MTARRNPRPMAEPDPPDPPVHPAGSVVVPQSEWVALIRRLAELESRVAARETRPNGETDRATPGDSTPVPQPEACQRRLDGLLANLPGMAYRRANDSRRTLTWVSPGCRQLTGYDPSELTGDAATRYEDLIEPADRARIRREEAAALARRVPFQIEYRLRGRDGVTHWVRELGRGDFDGHQLRAVDGLILDAPARQAVETARTTAEARFRHLLDHTPALAIQGYGPDGTVHYWNQASEALYGYSAEEAIGANLLELLLPPEQRPEFAQAITESLATGRPLPPTPLTLRRKDGRPIEVLSSHDLVQLPGEPPELFCLDVDLSQLRQAEEAVRASEQLYRGVIENIQDMYYRADRAGILLMCSPSGADLFAAPSVESMVGRPLVDSWADPTEHDRVRRHLYEHGEVRDHVAAMRRWDGSVFHTSLSCRLVRDERGQVVGTEGILRDINARVQAEQEHNELTRRLRTLINITPDIICFKDGQGRWLEASAADLALFHLQGVDYQGLTDTELAEFVHPLYQEAFRQGPDLDEAVWAQGELSRSEECFPLADGGHQVLDVIRMPHFSPTGEREGMVVLGRDITARKAAEETLRAREEYIAAVLDSLNDAVFVDDASTGRILEVNETTCRLYGYSREEFQQMDVGVLSAGTPPYTQAEALAWLDQARQGRPQVFEWLARHRDGHLFWVEVNIRYAVISGQERFIVTVRDIEERKQAEADRQRLERQFQQAQRLDSLGVLAGGIAHDFNNILMAVMGHAELARMDLPAESGPHENLRQIETAARRAADLCRQMLAYAGRASFTRGPVHLGELITEMSQLLRSSAPRKTTLTLDIEPELPAIQADASQIRQIVLNLIVNAAEAIGDQAGAIRLSLSLLDSPGEHRVGGVWKENLPPGRYIHLDVTDTGCGMSEETQARMFEPFYTTKFSGRGLGLAAVLGIVRAHGGEIAVTSQPGQGASIALLFPVPTGSPAPLTQPAADSPGEWRGQGTILLVDDEASLRELGARRLSRAGYTVLTAANGRQAIEVYRGHTAPVDLVLMDLTMPEMDGAEAAREIQRHDPGARVVLASGFSETELWERFSGLELAGVLQKPYTLDTLQHLLIDLLPPKGPPPDKR